MNPIKYNTYKKGQCTYYVFYRIKRDGNQIGNSWNDAKDWDKQARHDGYLVNQTPQLGAILQSSKRKHGHVAYIEKINKDGYTNVSDMNYN